MIRGCRFCRSDIEDAEDGRDLRRQRTKLVQDLDRSKVTNDNVDGQMGR